jgi:hypothetical protein
MIVTDSSFSNILESWTKDYFYSVGQGELWDITHAIGEQILEDENHLK